MVAFMRQVSSIMASNQENALGSCNIRQQGSDAENKMMIDDFHREKESKQLPLDWNRDDLKCTVKNAGSICSFNSIKHENSVRTLTNSRTDVFPSVHKSFVKDSCRTSILPNQNSSRDKSLEHPITENKCKTRDRYDFEDENVDFDKDSSINSIEVKIDAAQENGYRLQVDNQNGGHPETEIPDCFHAAEIRIGRRQSREKQYVCHQGREKQYGCLLDAEKQDGFLDAEEQDGGLQDRTNQDGCLQNAEKQNGFLDAEKQDGGPQNAEKQDNRRPLANDDRRKPPSFGNGLLPRELCSEAEGDLHEKQEWLYRDIQALR